MSFFLLLLMFTSCFDIELHDNEPIRAPDLKFSPPHWLSQIYKLDKSFIVVWKFDMKTRHF